MSTRSVIGGLDIRDGKVLLARKKQVWILPGGKEDPEETDIDCLMREISEEIPGSKVAIGNLFDVFSGVTPHTRREVEVWVYLCQIDGQLVPAREISQISRVTYVEAVALNLSEITREIIETAKNRGLFN